MTKSELKSEFIKWVEIKTPFNINNELLLVCLENVIEDSLTTKNCIDGVLQPLPPVQEMLPSVLESWISVCRTILELPVKSSLNFLNVQVPQSETERLRLLNEVLRLENLYLN